MKERFIDKLKRIIRERKMKRIKRIIKKYVRKWDVLNYEGFLAFSWRYDDVTDYHVISERSYPELHVYGTRVERWIDGEWVADK